MSRPKRPADWVDPDPVRFDGSPGVVKFALRYKAGSQEGCYEVGLMVEGWWECDCKGFSYRDRCKHVEDAQERWRAEQLQRWRASRRGAR